MQERVATASRLGAIFQRILVCISSRSDTVILGIVRSYPLFDIASGMIVAHRFRILEASMVQHVPNFSVPSAIIV